MNSAIETALLATKLRAPTAVRAEVTRLTASSLIEGDFDQSLCVVASAGSGKSTFLRQLQDGMIAAGRRCAWLNLDSRDDDAATLIPYLFDVFEKLGGPETSPAQRPVDFNDPTQIRSAFSLLERLAGALNGKCVLFLDDFHYIDDPNILKPMNHLLDACAAHVQVIMGSRTLPDLQIPRRILSGQFMSLPDGFLKFSQQEAEQFFAARDTVKLDPDEISALNRSTEGWVAGLQFAAISLKNSPGRKDNLIAMLPGNEKNLSDYLATNVFQEQSPELRKFLLKTAPLGRFNGALCRHVSGFENAAEILRELMDANLFLISLDGEGEWFRYHHLFADFLNAESGRLHPQEQEDIRLLASQ